MDLKELGHGMLKTIHSLELILCTLSKENKKQKTKNKLKKTNTHTHTHTKIKNKKKPAKKQYCITGGGVIGGICGPFTQVLYEYIENEGFIPYQNFSNISYCVDWQGWEINNQHFMSILSGGNMSCHITYNVTNTVYKWDTNTQLYLPFQYYHTVNG